jgi:hypothetical protein
MWLRKLFVGLLTALLVISLNSIVLAEEAYVGVGGVELPL